MKETTEKWKPGENTSIALSVRTSQIQHLYKQTWGALTGNLAIAVAVCIALWQVIPHGKLLWWIGILSLITIARALQAVAFQKKSPSGTHIYRWAKWYVIGVIAAGLMWGAPSLFLWPENSPTHQLVWPICIVALSSVATAKYCTWTPAYISFLLLSTVPISLRMLSEGGVVYVILGLLGFLFIAILANAGKVMHTTSLQTLEVGIRNQALSAFLSEEKTKAEELNTQLHLEIAERERSQEELRLRNKELERLNTQLTATKNSLESANKELAYALANIKQLSGMLPICAECKKNTQ